MIPITRPLLGADEAEASRRVVLSGWLSQGVEVAAFERSFAEYVGAEYACAVSNCTTALHLALEAVGVKPGGEVITASHSFIATANAIHQCGATPVFVDIEAGGFNIDAAAVASAITPRTQAILCVHQIGMPCNLPALLSVARAGGLPLVEDAACAIGSEISLDDGWTRIGKPHGDVACFSFHPRKVITTGEGGMLTTNRPDLDARFRLLRQHGMSIPDTVRHSADSVIFEDYPEPGYNYRMTDIQAAIGREQMKRLPAIVARRRALAQRYRMMLADLEGVLAPREPAWARSNWQSYCVVLDQRLDQRSVMQSMLDNRVATRRGIMCSHLEAAWSGLERRHGLLRSEAAHRHAVLLPLYPQMTDDEQQSVVRALAAATRQTSTPGGRAWAGKG